VLRRSTSVRLSSSRASRQSALSQRLDPLSRGILRVPSRYDHRSVLNILDSLLANQNNTSKGRGHDRLPKNGGMLISHPISRCLTNHSELCMSRLLNNQPRRISIYRLQRRPSFGFESSVSSAPMTSGDPVGATKHCRLVSK